MKKRSIITITAALLLLGMLRGCAKTPPAYDPSMAALLSSFDSDGGTPQPYGLPPSYAPAELMRYLRDDMALRKYQNLRLSGIEADERLRELTSAGELPEIVGGYQGFVFREEELVLDSDGSDLLVLLRLTDSWYYLLCLNGRPEFLLILQGTETARPTLYRILPLSSSWRRGLRLMGDAAEAESPLLVCSECDTDPYQLGNSLLVLRTAEGDKGYPICWNQPLGLQEGRHLIGYRQLAVLERQKALKYWYSEGLANASLPWNGYVPREPGGNPPDFGRLAWLFRGFPIYLALLFGGTFGAELVVIHRRRVKQR